MSPIKDEFYLKERIKSLSAKLKSEKLEKNRSKERLIDLQTRIETTYKILAEVQNAIRE